MNIIWKFIAENDMALQNLMLKKRQIQDCMRGALNSGGSLKQGVWGHSPLETIECIIYKITFIAYLTQGALLKVLTIVVCI